MANGQDTLRGGVTVADRPPRRVELCSQSGAVLRGFDLAECEGGPHDTRGMRRSTLLAALADALPDDAIRFGCAVEGVDDAGDDGAQPDGSLDCLMKTCR